MTDAPLLEVAGLEVVHHARRRGARTVAVTDVSFSMAPGEVLGLVGASGGGKTTICHAVLGLHPWSTDVTADRLVLAGRDLTALDGRGWQAIRGQVAALVPQQPITAFVPTVAVGRQLEWHLGPGAVDHHRDALVELGLRSLADRPNDLPTRFSGGQLQRAAIALATLRGAPRLLVADEPTSTLDPTVQARVLELLMGLRTSGGTAIIHVSHDLAAVARHADRVGVVHEGRLVELRPTEQLFGDPRHPHTRALVDALPHRPRRSASTVGHAVRASPSPIRTDEQPSTAPPLLEVDRAYRYHARPPGRRGEPARVVRAVDDVSLSIAAGTTTALVGESGAGKTTLARLVIGDLAPTAGTIRFEAQEIGPERTPPQRRSIQLVPQNVRGALNRSRTIEHALDQAQRVGGSAAASRAERRRRSVALLARVGLGEAMLRRRPGSLSGGEVARVVLARALLAEPRLLVLDEPTSALDPLATRDLIDLLRGLRDEGLTMLLVTHELDVALALAQDVVVLRGGRVVEAGPTRTVLADPRHEHTQELVASIPPDPRTREERPAGRPSPSVLRPRPSARGRAPAAPT